VSRPPKRARKPMACARRTTCAEHLLVRSACCADAGSADRSPSPPEHAISFETSSTTACVDLERGANSSHQQLQKRARAGRVCPRAREWGRRHRRPQCLRCGLSAVRAGPRHQRQRRRMHRSRHRGPRSSHRRRQRRRHRRIPSLPTSSAEPASATPRTASEPTPRAPSPRRIPRLGAVVAIRFTTSSNHRSSIWNLPHRLRMTPTDLAGGERWDAASGRSGEPCPPITGRIVHYFVVIARRQSPGHEARVAKSPCTIVPSGTDV
jgi:hypothetical protein